MKLDDISNQVKDKVFVQNYTSTQKIDGVEFVELKEFTDCGGTFSELVRVSEGKLEAKDGFNLRQVNYSVMEPGAVKAFHLHYQQDELWFVPPKERLIMGLLDARANSSIEGVQMRFIMGVHKPRLLYIPAGVAHGAANPYIEKASVMYFTNQQFNLSQPDEQRLPWNVLGEDFWQIRKE